MRVIGLQAVQTEEEILAARQHTDPKEVDRLYQLVVGKSPLSLPRRARVGLGVRGWEFKRWWKLRDQIYLSTDGLSKADVLINHQYCPCTVAPRSLRTQFIWGVHCQTHAGQVRTVARLRLQWYWPGITVETRRLLTTCEVCQLFKVGGAPETQGRRRLYTGLPWQWVAIELVGPMSATPLRNHWILVLTDHFTRWRDAIPIPDATTLAVATALEERVFSYFGISEIIHSDQGPNSSLS